MWTLIIAIVIFIVIKFAYDSSKQSIKVAKEGGIKHKYRELIHEMMGDDPSIRIFQESTTSVTLGKSSLGGRTSFLVAQTFGNVTIQWKTESPFYGSHKLEWDFPEYGDQQLIAEIISHDLLAYQTNQLLARI